MSIFETIESMETRGDLSDLLAKLAGDSLSKDIEKPKGWFKKRCPKDGHKLVREFFNMFTPPRWGDSHLYEVWGCPHCDYFFVKDHIVAH